MFPHWPIQRLVVAKPELKGQAVVLYATEARRVRRVVASSRAARQQGIRPPMLLADASSLLRRQQAGALATRWYCQPHDAEADAEVLARLAQFSERFSPLVGLRTAGPTAGAERETGFAPGDCLFFDVTGVSRLFGGERALAARALAEFTRMGYRPRLGLADTVGAAWAAAQFLAGSNPESLFIVPPGESEGALRSLPLEALRLSPAPLDTLHQLGVLRVEQLVELPRASLAVRVGPEPLRRWDQALGRAAEPIVAHRPPPEYQAQMWLEHPTALRSTIEQLLAHLLDQLAASLAARQRGALRLECRLDCAAEDPLRMTIGLFRPTARVAHWMELVRMQFEQMALPGAVQRIHVEVLQTAELEQHQVELFESSTSPRMRDAQRQLSTLVDRLSSRLGPGALLRPHLRTDAQPEEACTLQPAANSPTLRRSTRPLGHGPLERPLWLYQPPRPIEVVAVAPDGPPVRLQGPENTLEIVRYWGPERIETGWWRGPRVRRDYYQIETRQGARYWIFRRLTDGYWFLHGEFF